MKNINVWSKIDSIDRMKQEQLFLIQKYRTHKLTIGGETYSFFDAFMKLKQDENSFKKELMNHLIEGKTFDYNGKQVSIEYLKSKKIYGKLQAIQKKMQLELDLILHDVLRYVDLQTRLQKQSSETVSINGKEFILGDVTDHYSSNILAALHHNKTKERHKELYSYETELDSSFEDVFGLTSADELTHSKELQDMAWKYDFFKLVQKSAKKGYVFTYRELEMIHDVVDDLRNGEVVLFVGHTGSGKTELARFIAQEFLSSDYVFVSGSRDKEESDFTIEKVVTSRSKLDTDNDIIDEKEESLESFIDTQASKTLKDLINQKSFKQLVIKKREQEGGEEGSERDKLTKELDSMDLSSKSLVTEYHLMGVYKAAKLGIPCIIDEVNIIRPEVFMALNDVLTRKIGNNIQLPNALGDIQVKKGFCIILTGNDPNSDKYQAGRNAFDEATYNRLSVYAKNYLNQEEHLHNENKLDEREKTSSYIEQNELYGVILMMMFNENTMLSTSGKYGFEVMKKDFDGKHIDKASFFAGIKKFSYAISMIQRAFGGETIALPGSYASVPFKDILNKKVFSMRDLIKVLESYKKDVMPLEFHLWQNFISGDEEEVEYALLVVFSHFGFFGNLVTDNKKATISNVSKKMSEIKEARDTISPDDVENKYIVTKQDLYKEYFGSMEVDDSFWEGESDQIEANNQTLEDANSQDVLDVNRIELRGEDLIETASNCLELLNTIIDNIQVTDYMELRELLKQYSNEEVVASLEDDRLRFLNAQYTKIYNIFDKIKNVGYASEEDITLLRSIINKTNHPLP